jgi:hypothetical protein
LAVVAKGIESSPGVGRIIEKKCHFVVCCSYSKTVIKVLPG